MEMDLNSRNAKWKREEAKRREQAKRRLQTEQLKRAAAAKVQQEMEALQAKNRKERLEEQERLEAQALEEQRITGGIKYVQQLRPVPTTADGDKIVLPVAALEELNPQNAHELGVFTFELSFEEKSSDITKITHKTHAGVLEFVADEGTVGLPPKVAASLFRQTTQLPELIQVKFIRLEKGKFASLQPKGNGFGNREIDFKKLLERSLTTHTTLTVGDTLFVRHGKETFQVEVAELQPEDAVNILNTDLEVALLPSEAIVKTKEAEKRAEEAAARAIEVAQEKERWKAEKMKQLAAEPSLDERSQIKISLRLPDGSQGTRRFLHDTSLRHVFDFVEALTGEDARAFQLASRFPRRVFQSESFDKTLKELQLNGRQEALFVEKVAAETLSENSSHAPQKQTVDLAGSSLNVLSGQWGEARKALERYLDEILYTNTSTPIHALEPVIPVAQSTNQETKWEAQLNELEAMGFVNRTLNIEVLERYQGRLLRVVNYLSELGTEQAVTPMEE